MEKLLEIALLDRTMYVQLSSSKKITRICSISVSLTILGACKKYGGKSYKKQFSEFITSNVV